MASRHSDEFKQDAVRITLTIGLTRRQVASVLGIGLSTLGKWVRAIAEKPKVPEQGAELLRENERLRKEKRIHVVRSEQRSSAPPLAIMPSTSRRISGSRTSRRADQIRSGRATSPTCGTAKGGSISPLALICFHGVWSAGRSASG